MFDIGTDVNTARLQRVQDRLVLAFPHLPTTIQHPGVTIRKTTPDRR